MGSGVEGVQVLTAAVQRHALIVVLHRLVVTGDVVLLVAGLSSVLLDVRNNRVARLTSSWNQSIRVLDVGEMSWILGFRYHGGHSTCLVKVLV